MSDQAIAEKTRQVMEKMHANAICEFVATLCADPDGLPTTRAGLQRSAEVYLETCPHVDFELVYTGKLHEPDVFDRDERERAHLVPKKDRIGSIRP